MRGAAEKLRSWPNYSEKAVFTSPQTVKKIDVRTVVANRRKEMKLPGSRRKGNSNILSKATHTCPAGALHRKKL